MNNQIVITGASSMIGEPLADFLRRKGQSVIEISRQKSVQDELVIPWDMQEQNIKQTLLFEQLRSEKESILIHCAPIWLLSKHVPLLASCGVKRIIAFSSSSIEGKADSKSEGEQQIVQLLNNAEQNIQTYSRQGGIQLTIFRPTMIYGYGKGQNLAFIAKFIERFGMFPLITKADGLRKPVHVDDLVNAAYLALNHSQSYGKIYNLSGRESLSYEEMVNRIFQALGKKPVKPKLPLPIYRQALKVVSKSANLVGKPVSIDPSMADRMRQNLDFDNNEAINDFNFDPSNFLPNGKQDLLE